MSFLSELAELHRVLALWLTASAILTWTTMDQGPNQKIKRQDLQENILPNIEEPLDFAQVAGSSSQRPSNAGFPLHPSLQVADLVLLTLFCIIHGEETSFPVHIRTDASVSDWRRVSRRQSGPGSTNLTPMSSNFTSLRLLVPRKRDSNSCNNSSWIQTTRSIL